MKLFWCRIPPVLFSIMLCLPSFQPVFATETLTWENCQVLAAKNNPTLLSARKQMDAKASQYHASFDALLPSLSLGYSYGTSSLMWDTWQHQASGNVQWELFNWKDYTAVQLAASTLDEARATWQITSSQIRGQLRRAFFQLLYAQEQIALLERIRQIRQTNAQTVTLAYNSGRESKGNMLITQADFSSASADLSQAQRNLRVAQQALNHLLGRSEESVMLAQTDFYLPAVPAWEEISKRVSGVPQLKRDDALLAESRASLQSAWGSLLPNLTASYSRGLVGTTFFPTNPTWNTALSLSWPIFGSGPGDALFNITTAQAQLSKAEADRTADLNQLHAAAESAWSTLSQAIDQVQVQKQYQDASLQRNDEATIEYSNGLLTFENWNQVVASLVSNEKQYLSARLNAILAEIDWQSAFATPLEVP